ncbi:hypothetical protein B0H17DRAFT_1136824 [Mycena rosella]|uniref:Uncharacterized protein n=1 Tax=Mycena rosella TaxID=1033263 RepID=A0AAD7DBA2_MYCRO|nr:hypothetical protein B0H17DRAFT_1136824 [Mycena rosella]
MHPATPLTHPAYFGTQSKLRAPEPAPKRARPKVAPARNKWLKRAGCRRQKKKWTGMHAPPIRKGRLRRGPPRRRRPSARACAGHTPSTSRSRTPPTIRGVAPGRRTAAALRRGGPDECIASALSTIRAQRDPKTDLSAASTSLGAEAGPTTRGIHRCIRGTVDGDSRRQRRGTQGRRWARAERVGGRNRGCTNESSKPSGGEHIRYPVPYRPFVAERSRYPMRLLVLAGWLTPTPQVTPVTRPTSLTTGVNEPISSVTMLAARTKGVPAVGGRAQTRTRRLPPRVNGWAHRRYSVFEGLLSANETGSGDLVANDATSTAPSCASCASRPLPEIPEGAGAVRGCRGIGTGVAPTLETRRAPNMSTARRYKGDIRDRRHCRPPRRRRALK